MTRGPLGDTMAEASITDDGGGVRVRHGGSAGWIEGIPFAGRRIDGAFAIVDAGAPNVSIARNRLDIGETGNDGRRLVSNLRPYDTNIISINADDLPIDRAPASPDRSVTPVEGSGVVVRFSDARERIMETHIAYADGTIPQRGAVLVRARDGARFPISNWLRSPLKARNQTGSRSAFSRPSCSVKTIPTAAPRQALATKPPSRR